MRPSRPLHTRAAIPLVLAAAFACAPASATARERVDSSLTVTTASAPTTPKAAAPERGARIVGTRALDEASHAALISALGRQAELNRAAALAAAPPEAFIPGYPVIVAPPPHRGWPHASARSGCAGCSAPPARVPKSRD